VNQRAPGDRGYTLVELLVVVVLAGVVAAVVCRSLQSNQRFYRSQSQVLDVEEGLRAIAQLVPAELRELNAGGGDVIAMGRDSITLRAMRSLGVICAPPAASTGTVIVADSLTFGWRAVDPSRDRALVFRDGSEDSADDDRWLELGVAGVSAGACGDGSGGTTLRLTGPTSELDSVSAGSPLRTYERVTYRLYTDEQGLSWLGERGYSDGGWSALSPVAGPLRRAGGLSFDYYDSAGAPATAAIAITRIALVARGLSAGPIAVPGRATTGRQFEDSVVVQVALRNN
jgi:prepilin-type N-terminal cleavage/methylation domain-containing protein